MAIICYVLDPPRLNLSFGLSLNAELIDEGKDVYLMCEIEANPKVYKIGWRHWVRESLLKQYKTNSCIRMPQLFKTLTKESSLVTKVWFYRKSSVHKQGTIPALQVTWKEMQNLIL